MSGIEREFESRAAGIARHGLGLSVDVYTPDLFEVQDALRDQGLAPGYLELFKAEDSALAAVRDRMPSARLAYHAEGLWITQPGWDTLPGSAAAVATVARHAARLGCAWINHECAAKEMAGYAFGTYLPPLFTRAAAAVTAQNLRTLQEALDRRSAGAGPLVVLEVPPLTYVGFGGLTVPEFFGLVTEQTACGLCLDLGHVWTVYRYTGAWRRRPLRSFLADFLERFPLYRVVQVHVAGLEEVHAGPTESADHPPWWIDAHQAPIPEVLFEMLDQVLSHPALRHVKGLALEVDTKPVPLIVSEYRLFRERYGWWEDIRECAVAAPRPARELAHPDGSGEVRGLESQYARYVGVLTGRLAAEALPGAGAEPGALELYRTRYLPNEILRWGGDLRDMFPETCRDLDDAGVDLAHFVEYWFRAPRPARGPYDFFLLKLERFPEFVAEVLPDAASRTARQARELRAAYDAANKGSSTVTRHS